LNLLPRLLARRYPHLLLSAGACSSASAAPLRLSIDISCPRGAQHSANQPVAVAAVFRRDRHADRRTDGRTLDRFIDPRPACHASSVNNDTIVCRPCYTADHVLETLPLLRRPQPSRSRHCVNLLHRRAGTVSYQSTILSALTHDSASQHRGL